MSSTGPSDPAPAGAGPRRNARVALICVAAFVTMTGAAFAAVPVYRAFCQVTGFDGATKRATVNDNAVLAKRITVRFDANVRGDLP